MKNTSLWLFAGLLLCWAFMAAGVVAGFGSGRLVITPAAPRPVPLYVTPNATPSRAPG